MSKTNIDLGADTSFGVSASAEVSAGARQETNVGFDTTTKFLLQCGWNISAFNMSCSYSLKEWLITGKSYRVSGLLSKFATKTIDIGCKSYFAGAAQIDITSKDKITFVSNNAIKVRVKSSASNDLAGDDSGALWLDNGGNGKIEKCDDINIKVKGNECIDINKSGKISLCGGVVKLNSGSGLTIFDEAVSVGESNVCWLSKNLVADKESCKFFQAVNFEQTGVNVNENIKLAAD